MKQGLKFSVWPWQRTYLADIVFRSGRVQTLECWDLTTEKSAQVSNELDSISVKAYGYYGFLYIRLEEVVGVFYRRGYLRWKGFKQ